MPWEGSNLHKRSIAACLLCTADCHCTALLSNASCAWPERWAHPGLAAGKQIWGTRCSSVPSRGGYTVPKDTESEKESLIDVLITGWKVDLSKVWKCLLGLGRVDQKVEGALFAL